MNIIKNLFNKPWIIYIWISFFAFIILLILNSIVFWVYHKTKIIIDKDLTLGLVRLNSTLVKGYNWDRLNEVFILGEQSTFLFEMKKEFKYWTDILDLDAISLCDKNLKCLVDSRDYVNYGSNCSLIDFDGTNFNKVWQGEYWASNLKEIGNEYFKQVAFPIKINDNVIATIILDANPKHFYFLDRFKEFLWIMLAGSFIILFLISFGTIFAIKEKIKSEQVRLQNERFALLGQMSAGLAHEVRNPLGIILATVESIQKLSDLNKIKERASNIIEEVERLDRLVSDVLFLSRRESFYKRKTNLSDWLTKEIEKLSELDLLKNITIEMNFCDNVMVEIDQDRFRQVILNLLDNSLKAIRESGVIKLTLRKDDNIAHIIWEDSGRTAFRLDISKLWEPFYTIREGGTGLGMAVIKKIIDEHNGSVTAFRNERGGLTVKIGLKIA